MFVDNRQKIGFIMNIIVLVLELCAFITGSGALSITCFKFYTEDSNVFSLFACVTMLISYIRVMKDANKSIPKWVKVVKYMSVCCLCVTFIVVVFILAPFSGPGGYSKMLLKDAALFKHLLCPVFAFITYVFYEADKEMEGKYIKYALIPTISYAIITIALNLTRILHGPYPFLYVYEQPVFMSVFWAVIILFLAYCVAYLVHHAAKRVAH